MNVVINYLAKTTIHWFYHDQFFSSTLKTVSCLLVPRYPYYICINMCVCVSSGHVTYVLTCVCVLALVILHMY